MRQTLRHLPAYALLLAAVLFALLFVIAAPPARGQDAPDAAAQPALGDAPVVAVWVSGVMARDAWLPELRRDDPLRPTGRGLTAFVSAGLLSAPDGDWLKDYPKVITALRAYLPCVPSVRLIDPVYKHTFDTWFDRDFWQHCANNLQDLLPLVGPDRLLVLDVESYLVGERRYPRCYDVNAPEAAYEEARMIVAMAPFLAALRNADVQIVLLPGLLPYAPARAVATALGPQRVILTDEATYLAPFDAAFWQHYERNRAVAAALGYRYWPGFFLDGLAQRPWQRTLRERGVGAHWYFPRDRARPAEFWAPTWAGAVFSASN